MSDETEAETTAEPTEQPERFPFKVRIGKAREIDALLPPSYTDRQSAINVAHTGAHIEALGAALGFACPWIRKSYGIDPTAYTNARLMGRAVVDAHVERGGDPELLYTAGGRVLRALGAAQVDVAKAREQAGNS